MSDEKQVKPTRQVMLSGNQFEINKDGEVVIKSEEVVEALQSQLAQGTPSEAGGTKVGVSVNSPSK